MRKNPKVENNTEFIRGFFAVLVAIITAIGGILVFHDEPTVNINSNNINSSNNNSSNNNSTVPATFPPPQAEPRNKIESRTPATNPSTTKKRTNVKPDTQNEILIYGKVESFDNQGVTGIKVVLNYLGNKPITTRSGDQGYYQFKIDKLHFGSVKSFEIRTAGIPNCRGNGFKYNYKDESRIEQNIRLDCTLRDIQEATPKLDF